MKCLFLGHKFGEIKEGYQYCERCGIATKPIIPAISAPPHSCANGHKWVDGNKIQYKGYVGNIDWIDYKISQKCSICGERRGVWEYGHPGNYRY